MAPGAGAGGDACADVPAGRSICAEGACENDVTEAPGEPPICTVIPSGKIVCVEGACEMATLVCCLGVYADIPGGISVCVDGAWEMATLEAAGCIAGCAENPECSSDCDVAWGLQAIGAKAAPWAATMDG